MPEHLYSQGTDPSPRRPGPLPAAFRCPRCEHELGVAREEIFCTACGQTYPRLGTIPILLFDPNRYLDSCRRQLSLLERQTVWTTREIAKQMEAADITPLTRERCRLMIEAIEGQTADILAVLKPLLPLLPDHPETELNPGDVPAPLRYIHNLYRDWGWPLEPDGENERALAAVDSVRGAHTMGRTLVLGAGGCRLAYDLHRRDPDAETLVIDIDPFVFAVAEAVIRGGTVSLRESNVDIDDIENVSKPWLMRAPHGPENEHRIHFVLADGLEPPVARGGFDTVVTPWFIDVVPPDLRDFISVVHGLLRPGGRWLNLGPLRYPPERPSTLRFGREEIFDLATRAGFRVDNWQVDSVPYLVSKLNGRGKIESVLAFGATRLEQLPDSSGSEETPPSWLLFRHLPVPQFAGQSVFWASTPLAEIVVSAIDGRRTLEDIAKLVAARARASGVSLGEIREAVRSCLADVHPSCGSGRSDTGPVSTDEPMNNEQ